MGETIKGNSESANTPSPWDSLILNEDKTRKAEYLATEKGKAEALIEKWFDKYTDSLDERVRKGELTREEARAMKNNALEANVKHIETLRREEYERQQQQKVEETAPIPDYEPSTDIPVVDTPESIEETAEETIEETAPIPDYEPASDIPIIETPESIEDEPLPDEAAPIPDYEPTSDIPIIETPESIDDIDTADDTPMSFFIPHEPAPTGTTGEQGGNDNPDGREGETNPYDGVPTEDLKKRLDKIKAELGSLDDKETDPNNPYKDIPTEELEKMLSDKLAQLGPLAAVDVDFTHDKHELARELAERDLNEETAKAGLIKRLWKKTLFKKYYHEKYTREYIETKRTSKVDGEELDIYELVRRRSEGAIERFVLGATEDMRYIHEQIGKKHRDGTYDGEKLVEADEKTTAELKSAIEKFASAKIPEGGNLEDLKLEFTNEINRLKAEARDEGRAVDGHTIDNYLEVAIQARERVEHGISIERVMEGFKVYNAEARDSVRTEAHRDTCDKIINRLESGKIGRFVPAEVLAGAVSIAYALTQTGARALAGAGGGILVSSALAGLRERNRITEDRVRMLRDLANGLEYGNSKKTRKYEAKIAGTQYDIQSATSLAKGIEEAMKVEGEGRTEAILQAIAEARVRIDVSDHEQKDLISYSSEDERGNERRDLDIAVIRAENSLSDNDRAKLAEMYKQITAERLAQISEKDQDFKHKRAVLVAKKTGKTLLIGAATFLASQEIMAALDPSKIGIFEKYGLIKTKNNENASETLLASGFGLNRGNQVITESTTTDAEPVRVTGDQESDIARLESEGYTRTTIREAYTEMPDQPNAFEDVNLDSLPNNRFQYDGWANNGTTISDGNELRGYIVDGQFVSGMYGNSTMGNQVFNYDELLQAGRIKAFLTIGNRKFELIGKLNDSGQLTWGENGVFTTVSGETIKALGDNGEKLYQYFEIGLDNGFDAEGIQHIIPFATDAGRNAVVSGMIKKAVRIPKEIPALYEFTKTITNASSQTIPRTIFTNGIFVPETARTGLGGPRANTEAAPQEPTQSTSEIANGPAPTETSGGAAIAPETAPAPETTPAPESAPAAPEVTVSPELQARYENSRNYYVNNPILVGGEEGVNILTGLNGIDSARASEWWSQLSDAQKSNIRATSDSLNEVGDGPEWGREARRWILAQPR